MMIPGGPEVLYIFKGSVGTKPIMEAILRLNLFIMFWLCFFMTSVGDDGLYKG